MISDGNNDLPCSCPAGSEVRFNVSTHDGLRTLTEVIQTMATNWPVQSQSEEPRPVAAEPLTEVARQARIRQKWVDLADDEELLFADGFDDAIVGLGVRCGQPTILVYNRAHCIRILVKQGLSRDDAEEHFEFNVAGTWVGERTPMFLVGP